MKSDVVTLEANGYHFFELKPQHTRTISSPYLGVNKEEKIDERICNAVLQRGSRPVVIVLRIFFTTTIFTTKCQVNVSKYRFTNCMRFIFLFSDLDSSIITVLNVVTN